MACFCYKGCGPIKIIDGRSSANDYLQYLSDLVIPFAQEKYGQDFFLLHDNAPIHRARSVQSFLMQCLPGRVHRHPAYSPDLNPIEHIGNLTKAKIRKYLKVTNSSLTLEDIVRSAWAEVADNEVNIASLIDSMQDRYISCIDKLMYLRW